MGVVQQEQEDYAAALRAHQAAVDARYQKSAERCSSSVC